MKTLIVGLGISGRAAADFLLQQGEEVIGMDAKKENLAGCLFPTVLQGDPLDFSQINRVILSPGISPSHYVVEEAKRLGIERIGEAELALRAMDNPILGVTGTNGKTTVALLTAHVLCAAGIKARALGNVGEPLTRFVPGEVVVAEVSSYQLETMESRKLAGAVILNITPDHLDRYGSMQAYAEAKIRLGNLLKDGALFFIQEKAFFDFETLFQPHSAIIIKENLELLSSFPYKHLSGHEKENAMAAFLLSSLMGLTAEQFAAGFATFKKPAHRIEFIGERNGVKYFDDSKGTNPEAAAAAIASMEGGIFLIAGGVDKGGGYAAWDVPFAQRIKKIFAIGQAAPKIAQELSHRFDIEIVATLERAVSEASRLAMPGENVLLSPGCSSFDMFRDYIDRGLAFQRSVQALGEQK